MARLISYSANHIDVEIMIPGTPNWRLTGFYGFPERARGQQSWNFLKSLKNKSPLPWIVVGDFNDICNGAEKRGGNPQPQWLIDGFCETLDDIGLFDLGYRGRQFTWERGRGSENWIEERLDRAFATVDWSNLFKHAAVSNLETHSSDHSAIFVNIVQPQNDLSQRRFMFEQAWMKDPECKEVIVKSWSDSRGLSVPCKLSNCAAELKKWGGDLGKKISRNIDRIKAQIAQASTVRDDEHNELISVLDTRLNELLHQQEIFWSQRAKQFWLAKGDLNTQNTIFITLKI
ncbi:MAG: endonuclease/exonuclease/phosphatase family protein, partial [Candidatus Phytoplasma australasiaticum]|nr:endonuclease/exonuclease/phosphatase family protein [Candidatus Phytoplasma australasiaticum]